MPTLSPKTLHSPRYLEKRLVNHFRRGRVTPKTLLWLAIVCLLFFTFFPRSHGSPSARRSSSAKPSPGDESGEYGMGGMKKRWLRTAIAVAAREARLPKRQREPRISAAAAADSRPAAVEQTLFETEAPPAPVPPYTNEHASLSLPDFIRQHVGPPDVAPHGRGVWVTLGDAKYVAKFLSHTRMYLDDLVPRPGLPYHDLVVLCLDRACVDEGRKRNMLAYGGFLHDKERPAYVRTDTWAKAAGLAQILQAGYHTVFFDADIFFRWDVFERLPTLAEDTWDMHIQEESHDYGVNTGFMFMRANQQTSDLWQYVLDQVIAKGNRDQAKTNEYLETFTRRDISKFGARVAKFEGPTGIRVEVLDPEYYWGMHMGWYTNAETTLLHMTCAPPLLKGIIAGAHGFYKDVDGRYSQPPRILSLGTSMAGTHEEIAELFRILVAASMESGRALVPPLDGHFVAPASPDDGNKEHQEGNVTHSRFLWSLFDLEPLLAPNSPVHLLEPNYPEHATPYLRHDAETLADLHSVRELDLRPVHSYNDLLRRLDQPYYRNARHVRLITDEGKDGWNSHWSSWSRSFPPEIPEIGLCATPEIRAGCGNLCRKA